MRSSFRSTVKMASAFAVACAVFLRVGEPAGATEVRPVQGAGSRPGVGMDRFRTPEEARAVRVAWNQDPRYRRGPARSLRVDFDPAAHAVGAVGLEVPPLRAHHGVTLWVHAEACGARLRLRITTFVARHRTRRDWDRIQQLQVVLEGAACRIHLGALDVVVLERADGEGVGR